MSKSFSFSKIWFMLSVLVLTFLYGAAVGEYKWFPHSLLNRAADQARAITGTRFSTPHFMKPKPYSRQGTRELRPEETAPGLTVISTNWREYNWGAGVKILDRKGRTIHQWRTNPLELSGQSSTLPSREKFGAPHGYQVLSNGDLILNIRNGGMARLNSCGNVLWRTPQSEDEWSVHHSIFVAEDSTFWVSGQRRVTPKLNGLKRFNKITEDIAVHVSSSGEIIDKISILDVIWRNKLERNIAKQFDWREEMGNDDLTHMNDVEPLHSAISDQYPLFEAGDLVVSLRRPDLVFVFDPDTKEVKWSSNGPFMNQHDPDFIGNGWIGIFDNNQDFTERGQMLGGGRIVALRPHKDSQKVLFPTPKSDPFYTPTAGSWQMLENGNMLLTETHAGRVVEVNRRGQTVWEWVNESTENGLVPHVFGAKRLPITTAEAASWPCSSVDTNQASHPE